eukprot:433962_1
MTDVKETLCYVAIDCDHEMKNVKMSNQYELPDGNVITVGSERFIAPEIIFTPNLVRYNSEGIHKLLFNSIMRCDDSIRKDMWFNIVLCGGNTMFNGMPERLSKEIRKLGDNVRYPIRMCACPERKRIVWIGGSIFSSLSTFEDMWITKDEYDETGPSIVHKKCI